MSEAGGLIRSLSGATPARNFHSYVINAIGAGIVSGRFAVGEILPNDAAMMAQYGVSRTVLREALKTLEAKGLVEARPKVGTRVSARGRWNMFDLQVLFWHFERRQDAAFVTHLFDARMVIEMRVADLAAQHRTADHLRQLHYWAQQMALSATAPEPYALAALELHRVMAEAAQNPFLRSVGGTVELALSMAVAAGMAAAEAHGAGFDATARVAEHRALASAIERSDRGAAAASLSAIVQAELAQALTACT
ncbi:FadR/GntR family transcriptional regulator [Phaeovulum sp. W22_SRMD_FR3]|uniref:FadR/GntR family transcriptional regulator n=1 Tax=Phaeovulum sp. W22_SRMD_FR3 TaxID=3240274 RepID=UPI003F97260E